VVPLVFALSTFVVLLSPGASARLARDHPNAGSAFGFVAAILGPRAGLIAGWTLLGTYLCFAVVGLGAAGLFGANLLQRLDLWRDASSFGLTVVAALVVGPLCIIPTRRAGLVLLVLEGIAVRCHAADGLRGAAAGAPGARAAERPATAGCLHPGSGRRCRVHLRSGCRSACSPCGLRQAATLGEEVEKSAFIHPRVWSGPCWAQELSSRS